MAMDQSKKRKLAYAMGGLLAVGLGVGIIKFFPLKDATKKQAAIKKVAPVQNTIPEDIDNLKLAKKPDLLIATQKFTSLWRDILKTSFLKKMINEDILFYYDESESALSLKGAAKRIAFEREATMFDELLGYIFDRPVQIAFWKAYHGRPDHFMGMTKRSGLTDAMLEIAKLALDDKQLHVSGTRELDGQKVTIYELNYTSRDMVYFYSLNDEIVFYSNYHQPLPTKDIRTKFFKESSDEVSEKDLHTIFVETKFLSFGYQFFSPDLESLRFNFNEESGWKMALQGLKPLSKWDDSLLSALPVYPALCSFVPIAHDRVVAIFEGPGLDLKQHLSDNLAVCWYENSKIFSPLLMTKVKKDISLEQFKSLFSKVVGSFEKGILTPEELKLREEQIEKLNRGESVDKIVRAKKFVNPFDINSSQEEASWRLTREVSSPFGLLEASLSEKSSEMRSKKFFKVTLAKHADYLIFSADDTLVDKTIAAIKKTYPNTKDLLNKDFEVPLVLFDPPRVAAIIRETSLESLPEGEEALFRASLTERLFPAFEKIKDLKPILGSLNLTKQQSRWSDIEWRPYSSR
jgi:uncharacterized protein YfaA (DUF2138 family)